MIHRLLLVLVIAGFAAPLAASEPPAWDWTIPNNLHAEATGPEGRVVTDTPVRVGFVLHVMQVAGAEVLVNETIRRLGSRIVCRSASSFFSES